MITGPVERKLPIRMSLDHEFVLSKFPDVRVQWSWKDGMGLEEN
jgi:hypothetical protein